MSAGNAVDSRAEATALARGVFLPALASALQQALASKASSEAVLNAVLNTFGECLISMMGRPLAAKALQDYAHFLENASTDTP